MYPIENDRDWFPKFANIYWIFMNVISPIFYFLFRSCLSMLCSIFGKFENQSLALLICTWFLKSLAYELDFWTIQWLLHWLHFTNAQCSTSNRSTTSNFKLWFITSNSSTGQRTSNFECELWFFPQNFWDQSEMRKYSLATDLLSSSELSLGFRIRGC